MSHGGGYDGMYSRTALVPEENLGMVVLTNSMTGITNALVYKIIDFYLDKDDRDWSAEFLERELKNKEKKKERFAKLKEEKTKNTKPSFALDKYTGTFADKMYGNAEVKLENGRLVLGTWQHIFFYEGDGPRNRRVYVDLVKH